MIRDFWKANKNRNGLLGAWLPALFGAMLISFALTGLTLEATQNTGPSGAPSEADAARAREIINATHPVDVPARKIRFAWKPQAKPLAPLYHRRITPNNVVLYCRAPEPAECRP